MNHVALVHGVQSRCCGSDWLELVGRLVGWSWLDGVG